jgi:hypothetical protein
MSDLDLIYGTKADAPNKKPEQELLKKIVKTNASKPAIQHAGNTASHDAGKPAIQHAGTRRAERVISNPTEKMTYRFHPAGKYAVEDIKTTLERQHGIKTSAAEIVEESVLLIYEDLLENPKASKLAIRLASKP